ncbi:MAG: toxin [Subdoligranulum sp.]|nr:toxin [Subdoligranulum sp.]
MGTGFHGGFGNTQGAVESAETPIVEPEKDGTETLIAELEKNGTKFTKENIVFITKDQTGQIVWLEKGNSFAGLEHILNGNGKSSGHAADFEKAFGVTRDNIPSYLEKVITNGEVVRNEIVKKGSRSGYERIYYYEGNYYVMTGVGTNGFIISAYPIRRKE